MERFPHLIVPHFKGMVNEPDPAYECLLTGRDASGKRLSEVEVHRALESCPSLELVQDVRRALFAASMAVQRQEAYGVSSPQLFSPEGCVHRVGDRAVRGAQLFQEIWNGELLPQEVRAKLAPPVVEYYSDCTSREVSSVLAHLAEEGKAEVITDAYHVNRSQELYDARQSPRQTVRVAAPEAVLSELVDTPHLPEYFRALLHFGSRTITERLEKEGVNDKEQKDERKYRLLQMCGRRVEEGLAAFLRSDKRLLPQLFRSGLSVAQREGLPDRTR